MYVSEKFENEGTSYPRDSFISLLLEIIMNVAIPITKENVMEEKNASFHEIYVLLVRISDICTHEGLNR